MAYEIEKSLDQWRKELDENTFRITRLGETERAFTGDLYLNKETGVYSCACCGENLFISDAKYESGSGWPSFYEAIAEGKVEELRDNSHGMIRTEIKCQTCGAHLGHVFPDGPPPTGLRYCINSASLKFKSKA